VAGAKEEGEDVAEEENEGSIPTDPLHRNVIVIAVVAEREDTEVVEVADSETITIMEHPTESTH